MKASEANFLKFLQKDAQFVIPIYQRTYSWTVKQCQQLWDDILRAAANQDTAAHFVGSIVYIEKGIYQLTSVPQLLVIDGQQRLTTISLLLAALREAISQAKAQTEVTARKIQNYYLFNAEESGELKYKLLLTQGDRDTLKRILDNKAPGESPARRLIENQEFFARQIASSPVGLDDIFRGMQKLLVVDISLDRTNDNPQLIFESLNSTGLSLSQADLVRNYILMDLEPKDQETVYTDHWFPMERSFGQSNYAAHFDRFMRDYLTVKTGQIPNEAAVYEAFKSYSRSPQVDLHNVVEDIHRYAGHFVNLALEREPDRDIRDAIADINTLKVSVAFPFLLEAYEDYTRGRIASGSLIRVLRLVESYVIRRAICGIPTNSLNKTFLTLGSALDKNRYVESLEAALLLMESFRRFPSDEEFRTGFIVRDIYNLTSRRNYILRKLENHNRKEIVNVESYTIEHIMPQNPNLPASWQHALGPEWQRIQKQYLHTIGNLTLTGYNSELSDRSFAEKRDIEGGFRDSPLRLNHGLGQLVSWDEGQIMARGSQLAELALQVWPAPSLAPEILATYREAKGRPKGYSLVGFEHLVGKTADLFEQIRRQILNLDPSVYEDILKVYIAYKANTNFVDIVPQKNRLRLTLNLEFDEINDPQGRCQDVTDRGKMGNGDVMFTVSEEKQIEYAMFLIRQSFEKQAEAAEE